MRQRYPTDSCEDSLVKALQCLEMKQSFERFASYIRWKKVIKGSNKIQVLCWPLQWASHQWKIKNMYIHYSFINKPNREGKGKQLEYEKLIWYLGNSGDFIRYYPPISHWKVTNSNLIFQTIILFWDTNWNDDISICPPGIRNIILGVQLL